MYKKYIMLNKGLDLGYEIEEYGILQYRDNGMYLSLLQDTQSKMVYKSNKNKLQLWYNKFYSMPTTDQRPDTVLHIRNLNDKDNRTYIFDAKYRISVDNGRIGPMVEDINVMHRYRDAIVSKMNDEFHYKYDMIPLVLMLCFPMEMKRTF